MNRPRWGFIATGLALSVGAGVLPLVLLPNADPSEPVTSSPRTLGVTVTSLAVAPIGLTLLGMGLAPLVESSS